MRPVEVLDHQASLIDYLDSKHYHDYLDAFLEDMQEKGKIGMPYGAAHGRDMCQLISRSLRVSEAYHVEEEMMPLLRAAAMDLDDLDYLVHERLPSEHGFLVFDEPWITTDIWGATITFKAIHWRHGTAGGRFPDGSLRPQFPGIWVTLMSDPYEERDSVNASLREEYGDNWMRRLGPLHINHITFLGYEARVGPMEEPTPESYQRFVTMYAGDESLVPSIPNDNRMVVALFRLLQQVIVDVSEAPIDRATARRMTKKRLPTRVQTIKLRRRVRPLKDEREGPPAEVEWQHSWFVRGHWAWRKCSADHPLAEPYEKGHHARVYIAPYPKGPEDKPMLITEKVWSLAR